MPKVIFSNTGEEAESDEDGALKEVVRAKGWPIAFGCEDGVCGTCIIEVEEGAENLSKMEETESQTLDMMMMKESGHRLACQCKVKGNCKIKGM